MRTISISKICRGLVFIIFIPYICLAQNQNPQHKPILFQGQINAHNINVRADSTVSAKIICIVNKGEIVEVIREFYEWYKIRLPKTAPSFIKKNLVALLDEKTAKVIKDNVNIRLEPNESSPILGKANKYEVINIREDREGWYKIEPLNNSFAWIHKKFVDKVDSANKTEAVKLTQETKKEDKIASPVTSTEVKEMKNKISNGTSKEISTAEDVNWKGIIKPYGKVFRRIATHKLIVENNAECSNSMNYSSVPKSRHPEVSASRYFGTSGSNAKNNRCIRDKVFLLKGNKENLDSLNHQKVRVTGKIIPARNQKYPVIEVLKIEVSD